jgi:hypothetical protein
MKTMMSWIMGKKGNREWTCLRATHRQARMDLSACNAQAGANAEEGISTTKHRHVVCQVVPIKSFNLFSSKSAIVLKPIS